MKRKFVTIFQCLILYIVFLSILFLLMLGAALSGSAPVSFLLTLAGIFLVGTLLFLTGTIRYRAQRRNAAEAFLRTHEISGLQSCLPFSSYDPVILEELSDMLDKQKELDSYSKHAEFLALQNQINPHFLYNTLEAIRSDALCAGLDNIARITKALATFFRYTISAVGNSFTVSDEIKNVENYFLIQNYRFGDRLKLELHFDSDEATILRCKLPKLTLQPIIENSIRHGLEPKLGGGCIKITFTLTDSKLLISILDDGVGMTQEKLDELNASLAEFGNFYKESGTERQSIAMRNVNTRIKLLFGVQYGLHAFSTEGVGTDIRITAPIILAG